MSRSSTKSMLIMFFNIRGIVYREFYPPGPDRQHKVLLQSSAAFEEEHSVKATRSLAHEEVVSPRRQCTLSPNTPHL
jgi:CRISPR/Cas system-associated endonuclease Cas1